MKIKLRRTTLLASDVVAMTFSAFVTYALSYDDWAKYAREDSLRLVMVQLLLTVVALGYFSNKGHYTWRNPWWQQVRQTIRTCFILILISFLVNLVAVPHVTVALWVGLYWMIGAVWLLSFRWIGRHFLRSINHWDIPTVLIGGAVNLTETIFALRSELYLRYDIREVVLMDYTPERAKEITDIHPDVNVIPEVRNLSRHTMVILCPDEFAELQLKPITDKIKEVGSKLAIVPPTNGFSLYGLKTQFFFGHRIVLLESRIALQTNFGKFIKNCADRIGALCAIFLLSPLFIVISLKVRKDGGPAFYGQQRIGKDGKPFKCWKFRSMIINADEVLEKYLAENPEAREEYERDFKLKNDPRITSVGHFIRKTSLDEIPQFFNVLKGEMSIVGPRPIVAKEMPYYEDKISYYLAVRPGVTGLWQVSGRNDISYKQRVAFDVWYVENWSLWNDIVIFLKTIYVVLARKGAY